MRRLEKALWIVGGLALMGFIGLQFFPIWHFIPEMDPRNPPVRYEVDWAPEAAHIMETTCYTCHSNETEFPVYMRIAPASWVAAQNVNDGRDHLNFSEEPLSAINPTLLIAMIRSDAMPPAAYRLTHPEANLTAEQKEALIAGIQATFSSAAAQANDAAP